MTTLTSDDLAALMLVARGNVWRQHRRDVRRGRDAPITVDARALWRAGLIFLKPDNRLGLTRAGRLVRDQERTEEQTC